MQKTNSCKRYEVVPADSTVTFEGSSSLHPVHGKVSELRGHVEAAWNADGSVAGDPPPVMHLEFPVERIRSGNNLQDREIWKLIDSRRFPKVIADLRTLQAASGPSQYSASGEITLAGRTKRYDGQMLVVNQDGDGVIVSGDLKIDIRDYGLAPPQMLFFKVDPNVRVHLKLVAAKGD